MYETASKPHYRNTIDEGAMLKRQSNVEEALDELRLYLGTIEDLTAGLCSRMAPVLRTQAMPHPTMEKPAGFGIPLADAIQQLAVRLSAVNVQLRDIHDRLGV